MPATDEVRRTTVSSHFKTKAVVVVDRTHCSDDVHFHEQRTSTEIEK